MKFNIWKKFSKSPKSDVSSLGDLLKGRQWGASVRRKKLEMIPLFGSPCPAAVFAPPAEALRLTKVTNYGQMILENQSRHPAIVPLHLGYFQNAAQNHAMCVSALLSPGESREFKDACCIQAAQGGYIDEADERFIILPHPLRKKALALAGIENYSKLWEDISACNKRLGLKARGHLDELKRAYQPELLRTVYYLEPHPEQTGAVFLYDDAVVGIELAPDPLFWHDLHLPLVMYCYAPLRLTAGEDSEPQREWPVTEGEIRNADDLAAFWETCLARRQQRIDNIMGSLGRMAISGEKPEENDGKNQLMTLETRDFIGQAVFHNSLPAYVSLFRGSL